MILAFDILLRKKALAGCIQIESNKKRFPNQKMQNHCMQQLAQVGVNAPCRCKTSSIWNRGNQGVFSPFSWSPVGQLLGEPQSQQWSARRKADGFK